MTHKYGLKLGNAIPRQFVKQTPQLSPEFAAQGNNLGGLPDIRGEVIYRTPGTYTFTVPKNVTSVCVVCIGGGGSPAASSSRFGSTIIAYSGNQPSGGGWTGGDAGFNGGSGGSAGVFYDPNLSLSYTTLGGGGGGAAGYTQNGGTGGNGFTPSYGGPWSGASGGGVGLYGAANPLITGGGSGAQGYTYSGPVGASAGYGPYFGAGAGGAGYWQDADPTAQSRGWGGGGITWKNNIQVTPLQTIQVVVGNPNGAVRIIWGTARSFPFNAM